MQNHQLIKFKDIRNNNILLPSVFFLFLVITACSTTKPFSMLSEQQLNYPVSVGVEIDGEEKINKTRILGKFIYTYQNVGGLTYFSVYLLNHTDIQKGESVLDIGTGSGVQAIFAAEKAHRVLATDINESALKSVLKNAHEYNVADKIIVRNSDLFNSIKSDEKFDVIISSIPLVWDREQSDWSLYERFFADAGKYLNPGGRIYFLAGFLNNIERTKNLIERNGLKITRLDMAYEISRKLEPMVYVIQHASAMNFDMD